MNKKMSLKNKIIALLLVIFMVLSLITPLLIKSFAEEASKSPTTTAASAISSSAQIIVNYYSGVPNDLTKDSPAFDLTVGLLDPNVQAIDGFDDGTGYAVLESASFYGETTNAGTLRQTGNRSSDGPMKMVANFKNVKYNGNSNTLTFRVGYAVDGVAKSEQVTFLVSQISINNEETETKKDPAPPPSPRVVIDECTYGGKTINTEESFTLDFSYFNSSSSVKMENLKIEVSGGENFVIKNNSNTFYIEELGPKGIKKQSIDFIALKSIKEDSSYPIDIKFSYEYVINKERKNGEEKTQIYVPVHKVNPPLRLSISDISCSPTEIEPEEESTVTIQLINKGEGEVKNVNTAISGNFKSDSYVKEIGTMGAGKVASPTFTITTLPTTTTAANSKNITTDKNNGEQPIGDEKANNGKADAKAATAETDAKVDSKIIGEVVVTYEDDDGNEYHINRSFGLNVNVDEDEDVGIGDGMNVGDGNVGNEEMPVAEENSKKLSTPWLIGIISGGVVVLGGASYFVVKRIKAKRSELLDEDI